MFALALSAELETKLISLSLDSSDDLHETKRLKEAYPHEIKLNDTEWGYMLDLDFGKPIQWVNNDTFLIDTTTAVLVTATTNCTNLVRAWDYPVYNMTKSKSFNSTG